MLAAPPRTELDSHIAPSSGGSQLLATPAPGAQWQPVSKNIHTNVVDNTYEHINIQVEINKS